MPDPSIAARARRADARRNRDAILVAARALFAEHGLEAPQYEIARRAGVGQGTLYRHFATRGDLIAALAEQQLDRLERFADRVAQSPSGFLDLFAEAARLHRSQSDVSGLIACLDDRALITALRRRFRGIVTEPLGRAQGAGLVRSDLEADDVAILLAMVKAAGERGPAAARRALGWALDAMRAGAPASPASTS